MTLLQIVWDFNPQVFPDTGIPVRWYGIFFFLAFLSAYLIMMKVFKREGLPVKQLDDLTLYVGIGTVVGARLGHCLFYEPDIYLAEPLRILKVWEGGLASHGAALGIILSLWLFVRKHKYPIMEILDKISVVVPLSGAFIRLGNLANSEIYGTITNLPWGFQFRRSIDFAHRFESHHPTQIYEALSYTLITIILWYLYKKEKQRKNGYLFGLFLILLFSVRFLIEFVKEPQVAFETTMSLNMGQLLSIPFIVAGVIIMIYTAKAKPGKQNLSEPVSEEPDMQNEDKE